MKSFKMRRVILVFFLALLFLQTEAAKNPFVTVKGNHFEINGKPYYYVGTNFWFGAILGSQGPGGNRSRLIKELDFMKASGINNLRVLVGVDGPEGVPTKSEPSLQTEPGKYNDAILDGLDFFMSELGKRNMKAVLYLLNSWEWSGGFGQYLTWNGQGEFPILNYIGWDKFRAQVQKFHQCESCKEMANNYIRYIISRTNRYTGKKYTEDPTLMSWQIANEPRAFSDENKPAYETWLKATAAFIRSLDSNHLISTGSEGQMGSENDLALYERIHADRNIDYLTIHIWPKNWSWLNAKDIRGSLPNCISKTNEYLNKHLEIARTHNKPLVIEEFGLPRDNHKFLLDDPTTCRDDYYRNIFAQILQSAQQKDALAGCNFWAWGGFARATPGHTFWQKGDAYMGDPGQEEQGLNSVFDTDSTIKLIKDFSKQIQKASK
jgi:mannan endo-1,4-beta-mannosidase